MVIDRETAIQRAEEIVIVIKVAMRSGGNVVRFLVQELADRFCKYKKCLVRGSWEFKNIKGFCRINKNEELNVSICINTIYDISKDKLFRNDELFIA